MMTGSGRHPIKLLLSNCQAWLWPWLSSALGWLTVLYVSAIMLIKYDTETTNISGAVFVAVAAMAGLAFTYAGALPNADRDRADVIYAGERLCQGAMIFLGASLLKYGTLVIPTQYAALSAWEVARFGGGSKPDIEILARGLQVVLFLIFVSGLLSAQLGYIILGRVVMRRISQRQTAEGYFPLDTQSASESREMGKKASQEE